MSRRKCRWPIARAHLHPKPDRLELLEQLCVVKQVQAMDFLGASIQLTNLSKGRNPAC